MNQQFKDQVFEIIQMIPNGRVTTYGAIAKAVGFPNHARQVGSALRNYDVDFPAHRVCGGCGYITASCLEDFILKLNKEGIEVKGTKIQNFKALFWDPTLEIDV